MKMRLAHPSALIDINLIPGLSEIKNENDELRFGALARHNDIEICEHTAAIPILHDCAAGIADVQVRNQGTIGGAVGGGAPRGRGSATPVKLAPAGGVARSRRAGLFHHEDIFHVTVSTGLAR